MGQPDSGGGRRGCSGALPLSAARLPVRPPSRTRQAPRFCSPGPAGRRDVVNR